MVPLRIKQVFTALLAVSASIGTAIITVATITTLAVSTIAIGGGAAIDKHLFTTASLDVNSLGAGYTTSSPSLAVSGALVGDAVEIGLNGNWAGVSSSVMVLGSVTAADTVVLNFHNTSGTAVDLTASTYNISVWSH